MKILLLGEFSALHKNLKEGLQELGHEAVIAAHGDLWKNIPRDIDLNSRLPSWFGRLHRLLKPFLQLNSLRGYDVLQLVNPFIFGNPFPAKLFFDYLIENNQKFFLLAAGDDAYFWRYGRKALKYGPFCDFLTYDLKKPNFFMENDRAFSLNSRLVERANGVIPIMHEYEVSYACAPNRRKTIPIPINTHKILYNQNKTRGKLVVFHGLNRYGFKGTRHVEEAFKELTKRYPNDLELIIKGEMPLNDYLDLMSRTNIVIDQVNSYSCGVNAVYALAMGKIVIGGAEPESLVSLGVENSPVINVTPSSKAIIDKIEMLLENKSSIESLGYESRIFAERVHGHIEVAKKYVHTWSKTD